MKVLILGHTGQVATELRQQSGPGQTAIALKRDQADLSNPEACAGIIPATDANIVINAAAWTAVDKAEGDEATASLVNVEAPAAMARAAADRGIPFLHVSTDYVYDGSGDFQFTPDAPTGPLGAYGRTKLAGDLELMPEARMRSSVPHGCSRHMEATL